MKTVLVNNSLTPEERAQARSHWLALMFAPSQSHLIAARQALKAGPLSVQKAVTSAIAIFWREGSQATPEQNPFD
jgi:hypothetical protein